MHITFKTPLVFFIQFGVRSDDVVLFSQNISDVWNRKQSAAIGQEGDGVFEVDLLAVSLPLTTLLKEDVLLADKPGREDQNVKDCKKHHDLYSSFQCIFIFHS